MRLLLAALPAVLVAGAPASASVFKLVHADIASAIETGKVIKPVTIADEGATVTLAPDKRIESHDRVEGEEERVDPTYRITVTLPGHPPFVVPPDEARVDVLGVHVGVGRLAKSDAAPVVILEGYSGGMHCCRTFQMIAAEGGVVKVLPLTGIDGDPGEHFPRDIDGDGVRDIERQDDAFRVTVR